jgi:hypothetical protein
MNVGFNLGDSIMCIDDGGELGLLGLTVGKRYNVIRKDILNNDPIILSDNYIRQRYSTSLFDDTLYKLEKLGF